MKTEKPRWHESGRRHVPIRLKPAQWDALEKQAAENRRCLSQHLAFLLSRHSKQ